MMYPYPGGSVSMQQSLRPFDATDPNYTTEDFLNSITANMVMTAVPEQTDSPFHEAWILKRIAIIQTALMDRHNNGIPIDVKKIGKRSAVNFRKHLITNNCKHTRNFY